MKKIITLCFIGILLMGGFGTASFDIYSDEHEKGTPTINYCTLQRRTPPLSKTPGGMIVGELLSDFILEVQCNSDYRLSQENESL